MDIDLRALFIGAFIFLALTVSMSAEAEPLEEPQMIVIEIERNLPDNRSFIIKREFNDLEDLLMWFENKVDSDGCDPYVDRVIMYPKGK
jgi:hypothetical protein